MADHAPGIEFVNTEFTVLRTIRSMSMEKRRNNMSETAGKYVAYVGTYTRGSSRGIYILDLIEDNTAFQVRDAVDIHNPSYLCLSEDGKFLYSACDEGVASFAVQEDGGLKLLGKSSVNGLRPSYISVDRENRFMICGGYHDGKLTSLRIGEDGLVGEVCDEIFLKGLGSVGSRHYRSHVSCALFSPDNRFMMATDLGMDQVSIYEFDPVSGKLALHDIVRCELESGPRDLVFSPDAKYAYVVLEYTNEVVKFAYDAENGSFTKLQSISTLPENYEGNNSTINAKVSPDGRNLLVTNSGNNSVAVYTIDVETQTMDTLCILPVSGEYPRDTEILPGGRMFASVNQEGNSLTIFKIDHEKKCFMMKKKPLSVPSPTCLRILKIS